MMFVLGLGAIAGFGSGFFHMGAHAYERRAAWERHVADVCTDSALRARSPGTKSPAAALDSNL